MMVQQPFSPAQDISWPKTMFIKPQLRERVAKWFGTVMSLALLGAVIMQLRTLGFHSLIDLVPSSVAFWITFAAYYLSGPASEWFIYHRLWRIPAAGLGALLRKFVSNELLLGYLGEAQFYAWARSRTKMTAAPFGTIKDVTLLSGLTGNIATLVMLVMTWPLISTQILGAGTTTLFASLSVVLGSSLIVLLFRRQLFSLPTRELWIIAAVHFARVFMVVGLAALMWHLVLPKIAISIWYVLSTLRLLVSRLPFLPNKDVVFAGVAAFMLGPHAQIAALITMIAGILLLTHLVVGGALAIADLGSGRGDPA